MSREKINTKWNNTQQWMESMWDSLKLFPPNLAENGWRRAEIFGFSILYTPEKWHLFFQLSFKAFIEFIILIYIILIDKFIIKLYYIYISIIFLTNFIFIVEISFYNNIKVKLLFGIIIFLFLFSFSHK